MRTIFLILMSTGVVFAPSLDREWRWERFEVNQLPYQSFTPERLKRYVETMGFPFPEIVMAQSKLETGNYTSSIFKKSNNLFGMRHPRLRETTSLGSVYGHASYAHWTDSVDDYLLWYKYHERYLEDDYLTFLNRIGYAEDKMYTQKLKLLT